MAAGWHKPRLSQSELDHRRDQFDPACLGLGTGPLLPSQFALVGEVLTPLDRIIFDATTGELFYDSNGSAAGGSALLATFSFINLAEIQASGGLKASDFLII